MNLYLILKQKVGCCYMGDMAFGMPFNLTARNVVATLQLEECTELQLLSVYSFLTGKPPQPADKDRVIEALRNLDRQ